MKHLLNLSTVTLILASGVTTAEVMPVESSTSRSHYDSWNETKQNLQKEHGLQLGMDYNMLSMEAIDPLGDSSAAAGALRVFGQWDLLEAEDGDKGGIVFKFEHRHKYTENSPKEYGLADLGYFGFAHSLYGDQGFRTTHLFWRQSLMQEQMVVYAGFLDMTDYTDFYALASPWNDFNNGVFTSGSGTIGGLPDGALGVMAGGFFSDSIYGSASILDAKGNASDLVEGAKELFDTGATWKSLELGWTPSKDMLFISNAHISLWQRDAVGNDDEGYGINLSLSGLVAERWLPFIRAGWAQDGGAMYDASVSVGFGYIPAQRNQDMFGLAVNWASPMESTTQGLDLDDQYTTEAYYRAQITPWLQISPSMQVLNHTAIDLTNGFDNINLIQNKTDVVFALKAKFEF
ncbi:carbohydrate porin [Vibrio lentus]|uniref:Porin n=1 Tax=Vibrio lentus TaxID=136468 RepID=A0AA44VTT2_9VIBR|nr:carbohydrate porin [Vibrio lentus]MCB5357851.1 carbohydrate porin [Vibrio lentus]MCB5448319.1 carbohydrate porin [Vibrio lentus]MCB5460207.1 carbohydrate porin [Vibrio lentus]MCC4792490.1 carbohydrate porin [Vibrio lentus]MCC4849250.1 carbohydrate porin [Vibrio lentus]